jgi:protein kinase C substrate 80K-H
MPQLSSEKQFSVSLYSVDGQFKCKDGSQRIPISQVNDDYCDCLDGSDEPGTSACSNGKFFCQNKGHKVLKPYRILRKIGL